MRETSGPDQANASRCEIVTVYLTDVNIQWPQDLLERFLESLPAVYQDRALRYKRWADTQMSVAGKLLLSHHLNLELPRQTRYTLQSLTRSPTGRPSLATGPDFNIAHSSGIVLLAVAEIDSNLRVGVDVEKIRDDWECGSDHVLTPEERQRLSVMPNPADEFFRIWTYKEAAVKADGSGLAVRVTSFASFDAMIEVRGVQWWLTPITLQTGFAAHVATSEPATVRVERIDINDLDSG